MANWHYEQDGKPAGPVSEDELRTLASTGAVSPTTRVWREGMGDWQPASAALPALFGSGMGAAPAMEAGTGYSAPPAYAAPAPVAYAAPSGFSGPVQIENQLVKSILITLFCCLPFGIVAIIKAVEANNKAAIGDAAGAHAANAEASKWIKYGLIAGLVVIGLYALMMVGGIFASVAGN